MFTYLNREKRKVIDGAGRDIRADVKVREKEAKATEGFALMDVQLLATSEEMRRGRGGEGGESRQQPPLPSL